MKRLLLCYIQAIPFNFAFLCLSTSPQLLLKLYIGLLEIESERILLPH